jgi:signal transduction histidine kinase
MSNVRVPLLVALVLLLGAALIASLVPAGLALDRRVTAELRRTATEDLGRAPMILEDLNAARAEALSMHAMTVATTEGLADAVRAGRLQDAVSLAREAAGMYGEEPVLVAPDGAVFAGPGVGEDVLAAVRAGESRVVYVFEEGTPRAVGLMPVGNEGEWLGAAGSASALDERLTTSLAALARADVTLLGPDGSLVASTREADEARLLGASVLSGLGVARTEKVQEVLVSGRAEWVARGDLASAGTVVFSRSVAEELAALPGVRRSALVAGLLTLVLALSVGSLVALWLIRPVRALAQAADRVSEGDFGAPVPVARVEEVDRLGRAFRTMREGLRRRLEELAVANQELEARERGLRDLQAELIRQDRLTSSARMAAELAHEIRNPVANVRNCLEVVRRALPDGSEGARFADMGIDELLRMHELAEQLLDLNRPADPSAGSCDPEKVAEQVATLAGVGENPMHVEVRGDLPAGTRVALPPDALKQVLFNLVQNGWEASGPEGHVEIRMGVVDGTVVLDVLDDGPGIAEDVLPKLFDPFFTTKEAVHGVGLGLFVAEGLARRYGGRMHAGNRPDGVGARFRIEVPTVVGGEAA